MRRGRGPGISRIGLRCAVSPYGGEHVLDPVALAVEFRVMVVENLPAYAGRDARENPRLDQGIVEPIGIMAPIRQYRPGRPLGNS